MMINFFINKSRKKLARDQGTTCTVASHKPAVSGAFNR